MLGSEIRQLGAGEGTWLWGLRAHGSHCRVTVERLWPWLTLCRGGTCHTKPWMLCGPTEPARSHCVSSGEGGVFVFRTLDLGLQNLRLGRSPRQS